MGKATFDQMLVIQKAPFGIGYEVHGAGSDLEFSHDGDVVGSVATFIMFPARGQGVAIMTNGQNGGSVINEIVSAVAAEYGWPDRQPTTRTTVVRDPKDLAKLAGTYRLTGDIPALITVTVAGETLIATITLNGAQFGRMELYADTDSSFFDGGSGAPVTFSRTGMTVAGAGTAVRIKSR